MTKKNVRTSSFCLSVLKIRIDKNRIFSTSARSKCKSPKKKNILDGLGEARGKKRRRNTSSIAVDSM